MPYFFPRTSLVWQWACVSLLVNAEARTGHFNLTESLLYLRFSQVSFCERSAIESFDCGDMCDAIVDMGMQPVRGSVDVFGPGNISGVQGFTAVLPTEDSTCVVAFRGSVNLNNWLTDAKAYLADFPSNSSIARGLSVPCEGCAIHHGFSEAYDELAPDMLSQLKHKGCSQLHVAGHSLGAGVATVAAMELRALGWQVPKVWVYGSPRVGNNAFVREFVDLALKQGADPPAWRVVHYHDPVPHTGPSSLYTHVPEEVYFPDRASALPPVVCDWDPENLAESRTSCGTWPLTTQDIADGLIQVDHTNYMNLTFALKDMNLKCQPVNACKLSKGYTSNTMAAGSAFLCILLGIFVGRFFTIYERLVLDGKGYCASLPLVFSHLPSQGRNCTWQAWCTLRGWRRRCCGGARLAVDDYDELGAPLEAQ